MDKGPNKKDLSPYMPVLQGKVFRIPAWCFEDTPTEFTSRDKDGNYIYQVPDDELSSIEVSYQNQRLGSYRACHWYPILMEKGIPTIESVIVKSNVYEMKEDLKDYISAKSPKFLRLCGASPKDVKSPPIFSDIDEAVNAVMTSERTKRVMKEMGHCCLFIRDIQEIKIECRCIVHKRKLRAVSVYDYIPEADRENLEESIKEFFELYQADLPYNSTVAELGMNDDFPFIIEFNSFGIDGFAGASFFDWDLETDLIYGAIFPEFRYPGEFDFDT